MRSSSSREAGKSKKGFGMSTAETTVEIAQGWFRALAGKPKWGEPVEHGIQRAARRVGLSRSQGKRLWYGDLASIPAHLFINLQERYSRLEATQERKTAMARQAAETALRGLRDAGDTALDCRETSPTGEMDHTSEE